MIKSKLALARKPATRIDQIRILCVEDHQVLREALIVLLEHDEGVVVSETASTAEEALQKLHQDIDLVILDLSLPGRDGFWLTRKIKTKNPGLPVLALTMHDEREFVVKALECGVDGYLTKWAGRQEILAAIRSLVENGSYLQGRIAPLVVDALRRRDTAINRGFMFNDKEHEIAKFLVKGLSNNEIAQQTRLSISAVKTNLRSLYSKLEVSTRLEAVVAVVEKKIV